MTLTYEPDTTSPTSEVQARSGLEREPSSLPLIISVDDHVMEPPNLWTDRLPTKFRDQGPHVVRERGRIASDPILPWVKDEDGDEADVWYYEDLRTPLINPMVAAGNDSQSIEVKVMTFDEVRAGAWNSADRIADMDVNHTEVSICFPNTLPRFCGSAFLKVQDKELALLCVKAYNDWMLEDWCGGEAKGRLIPMTMVPLWDVQLAKEELRRCADKGSLAVTFPENPAPLGLPSWYSGEWDPFFAECEETETTLCMHVGSSGFQATTGPGAPFGAKIVLTYEYGMHSFIDCILSGLYDRFPNLITMCSEGNVGWMPYILQRLDDMWLHNSTTLTGVKLSQLPSSYMKHIYGCIIDDEVGLSFRDRIGMDQICFETDYPHAASLWPNSAAAAERLIEAAGLDDDEIYKFLRGNAIKAFRLDSRMGIMS